LQATGQGRLDPLTSYLWDPISQGVRYCRLSIDRSALENFVNEIKKRLPEEIKQEISEATMRKADFKFLRFGIPDTLEELLKSQIESLDSVTKIVQKTIERVDFQRWTPELVDYLSPALDWMAFVNDQQAFTTAIKEIRKQSAARQIFSPKVLSVSFRLRQIIENRGLFDSDLPLVPSQDAIHIASHEHADAFILDVTSIKEEALNRFLKFLSDVPEINAGLRKIINRTQYSSRVVFEPYPTAVSAWVGGRLAAEHFPGYVRQSVKAAIRYYNTKEWRTSIVLSAIALETLLAEMFEDEFHKQADDIPLGALKDKIVESFNLEKRGPAFPNEIIEWIDKTNAARIAAVHRGSIQLSARETLEALRGFVKVALWYYYRDIMS